MTTKVITKRRRVVVCAHDRLYACVSERNDDRYATFVMCSICGEANPIDGANCRRLPNLIWSTTSNVEAIRANEGARVTILAGPSNDFVALALTVLAEAERRQVESLGFWYEHEAPPLLKTHSDEAMTKVMAKRANYDKIALRFATAREKLEAMTTGVLP